MRIGHNPHKDQALPASAFTHQLIVPVYLPQEETYFRDGLEILGYCLESLSRTVHDKTFISVVANGCSRQALDFLDELLAKGKIDELVKTVNIGKLNAILKGISGNRFDFVTIADSDVLFVPGWQQASYEVFEHFPEAGAVCPTPSAKSFRTHTANIWARLLLDRSLQFRAVQDREGLEAFAHSIGNPSFYNEEQLSSYLTVCRGDFEAVVGAGHFATTYRGDIFDALATRYSAFRLGGNSETEILDLPVVRQGYWRLATVRNLAFHMGNTAEPWMPEKLASFTAEKPPYHTIRLPEKPSVGAFYHLRYRVFSRLLRNKKLLYRLLQWKGLSRDAAKKYLQ